MKRHKFIIIGLFTLMLTLVAHADEILKCDVSAKFADPYSVVVSNSPMAQDLAKDISGSQMIIKLNHTFDSLSADSTQTTSFEYKIAVGVVKGTAAIRQYQGYKLYFSANHPQGYFMTGTLTNCSLNR